MSALELPEEGAEAPLPQHLALPAGCFGGETWGTLDLVETDEGPIWEIEGHPQAISFAKRLFLAAQGRGPGQARFPRATRTDQDLIWLLQRFPMRPKRPEALLAAWRDACAYERRRAAFAARPQRSPAPVGFAGTLSPFQEEGLAWMRAHARGLLADEMGLGKTVQYLAYLAAEQPWPAVVVAPPHLVGHWAKKLREFLGIETETGRGDPSETLLNFTGKARAWRLSGFRKTGQALPTADLYLLHYGQLDSWEPELVKLRPRALGFDECQELRKTDSRKYAAATKLAEAAERCHGFSGTPIYNKGIEIWNVMNALDRGCLGDRESFTREWTGTNGGAVISQPAVLGAYLKREGLQLRRRKVDVLTELPAKRRAVETIDKNESLFERIAGEAAGMALAAVGLQDPLARERMDGRVVNLIRKATGLAKASFAADFVRALVDAGDPTLCFCHHHEVTDAIAGSLARFDPVVIDGRRSDAEKQAALQAFAEGRTDLAFVSLRAAAGLDGFQARGRCVVFAELDWSPAVHSQAEDRLHRHGQRDSVLAYYLVTDDEDSSDPFILDTLGLKTQQFVGIMADPDRQEDQALAGQAIKEHKAKLLANLRARAQRSGLAPAGDLLDGLDEAERRSAEAEA